MAQSYIYTAMAHSGERTCGQCEVEDKKQLLKYLEERGLYLIHVKKKSAPFVKVIWRRQDPVVLERWVGSMAQFLGAGLSLVESLELTISVGDRRASAIGQSVLNRVQRGQSLSEVALAETAIFGEQFPCLFKRAESTGDLRAAFYEMLQSIRWQRRMRSRIQKVLFYPAIAASLIIAVVLFLLITVVPQLVSFVEAMNQQLPWHTELLFFLSQFLLTASSGLFWIFLIGLASFAIVFRMSGRLRRYCDSLFLKLPVVGLIMTHSRLARLFNCLSILCKSRVPLLELLEISQHTLKNTPFEAAMHEVIDSVSAGSRLAEALRHAGVFPELTWRMVRVGENSGDLLTVFENIRDFYQLSLTNRINKLEQILPSVLVLILGVILMWMTVSVLGPLYDSIIGAGAGML